MLHRFRHWFRRFSATPRHCLPVFAVTFLGLAVTAVLFTATRSWERRDNQTQLDNGSQHIVEAIRRATEQIQLTHELVQQDFYGSTEVSREEFALFAGPILTRVPSLEVLQWAPLVREGQRGKFERAAHASGFPDYRIVEPNTQGQLIPAKRRAEHFPIWYAATRTGFQARFGWDFAADPVLRSAIDRCQDTGRFVVSDVIDLSNIGVEGPVVQTFMPLYKDFRNVRTVADRRANLEGILVGLCQVDALVNRALEYTSGPQGIDVAVFDENVSGHRGLLCYHASRMRDGADSDVEPPKDTSGLCREQPLVFGGQRWMLVCTPAPEFFAANSSWRSRAVLLAGLFLTYLLATYTWSVKTRTERIEQIVAARTAEIRRKDKQLQEAQELRNKAIRKAHEETIQRLVTASLCRDEETGMHIKRTGLLSEMLAKAAGWSDFDAETIRLAAPMHDVGKIGIPDAILRKPQELTPEEYNIMKTHTTIGARMLAGSQSQTLAMAYDIALCHHERWDGRGYPRGLSGDAIPMAARIVSIVDVYDAVSHDRVYRKALPDADILKVFERGAGTQFDPKLTAIFLAHYDEARRIAGEHPDSAAAEMESPIPAATAAPITMPTPIESTMPASS